MIENWQDIKGLWVGDFEYLQRSGDLPIPFCYTARNLMTGEIVKQWIEADTPAPEYTKPDNVLIAYNANAEMLCHIVLGWPRAKNIIDPMIEYLVQSNGLPRPFEYNLYVVADIFGIEHPTMEYKAATRRRIIAGRPFTNAEKQDILEYCYSDIDTTAAVFSELKKQMTGQFYLGQALLRGRYMWAVAMMEYYGTSIDWNAYLQMVSNWDYCQRHVVEQVNPEYNVYDITPDSFKWSHSKFAKWLNDHEIPWLPTDNGLPVTENKFFEQMTITYPILRPLSDARYVSGQLKLNDLAVGADSRNRAPIFPFKALTGRNLPSSSKFIFGGPAFIRGLIKPPEGWGVAYIDFGQEEIAIAAKISEDKAMQEDYLNGDVYINFGIAVGLLPEGATKKSHPDVREAIKVALLGINYGMKKNTVAIRAKIPVFEAGRIMHYHKERYHQFHKWRDEFLYWAPFEGKVYTPFGFQAYTRHYDDRPKKKVKRTTDYININWLKDWKMQAVGADILRLSIILCLEAGIQVCAPVHDAILIQAPLKELDEQVEYAQRIMTHASMKTIDFPIKTDVEVVRYPDRYMDKRGVKMWGTLWRIIDDSRG